MDIGRFEFVVEFLFWACLAGLVYSYAIYPIAVWVFARAFGSRWSAPVETADRDLPSVSLLIAAYNEQAVIGERIDNALKLDYPSSKFEVVIASDGSSDGTNAIVRGYTDPRVRLLEYPTRTGKASVLNAAFRELRGDIVVLSDANTNTDPAAVRKLVRWFQSPEVGAVCGRLVLTDPVTGSNVDGLYWKYETFLKHCESRLGALLGANGAIYAIRRELFAGIRRNTLIDDFVIPLLTRLRTGCSIEYDPEAVAYEETPQAIGSEFKRRARIGTGGFQSLPVLWPLLNPSRGWIAFTYFSHKIARWLCPFFLIGAFASSLLLANRHPYDFLLGAQVGLYLVAGLGTRAKSPAIASKCLRLTTLFAGMNLALLVGFWRWMTSEPHGAWTRTARP
jgi:cellulose synthase/poly-beta-1,6-N-acetylglucosamine synthase-like glycosyltransferase